MTAPAKTTNQWLDELVAAAPDDRRSVSIAGIDQAGLSLVRVTCSLHPEQGLNWLSAFSHLDRTERSHQFQHPGAAPLHTSGDLRSLLPDKPPSPWRVVQCGRPQCVAWVIWAQLESGSTLPVDAVPVDDGAFTLVIPPGASEHASPLAMRVFPDSPLGDADCYQAHAATCATSKTRPKSSRTRRPLSSAARGGRR